jgi:hypothetical protein
VTRPPVGDRARQRRRVSSHAVDRLEPEQKPCPSDPPIRLGAKDMSEEWKRNTRLELELTHEVEFLRNAIEAVNARLVARQALVDEQVRKRQKERGA